MRKSMDQLSKEIKGVGLASNQANMKLITECNYAISLAHKVIKGMEALKKDVKDFDEMDINYQSDIVFDVAEALELAIRKYEGA